MDRTSQVSLTFDLLGRVAPQDRKIPLGFARRDFVRKLQAAKKKRPCPFPKKVVSDSGAYESSLALLDLLGRVLLARNSHKVKARAAREKKKLRPCPFPKKVVSDSEP